MTFCSCSMLRASPKLKRSGSAIRSICSAVTSPGAAGLLQRQDHRGVAGLAWVHVALTQWWKALLPAGSSSIGGVLRGQGLVGGWGEVGRHAGSSGRGDGVRAVLAVGPFFFHLAGELFGPSALTRILMRAFHRLSRRPQRL